MKAGDKVSTLLKDQSHWKCLENFADSENVIPYLLYLAHMDSKCSVKLHPNKHAPKMKVVLCQRQLLNIMNVLFSEFMSYVILGNGEFKTSKKYRKLAIKMELTKLI